MATQPKKHPKDYHDPQFVKRFLPYFSLLEKYFRYRVIGLNKIKKPSIVVMNHGIIPYHGFLLTKALIEKRGIFPRGLGATFLFYTPGLKDFFLKGGAVKASHRNGRLLLEEGHVVMLAPGGIYEGLVCEPGMKRIPWERRKGFVELACETNTPIVPTFCPAINDVYYNSKFLLKARIKVLEKIRFSLPIFCGLGVIPLPKKLTHFIGNPILITKKKGESKKAQIDRIHGQVIAAMNKLASKTAASGANRTSGI